MVSTSLSLQNSYNYAVYHDQSLPKKSDEQQKTNPFKPIHSVWSFFKSNTLASAERIFQEQQKVIKSWEETLSTFYTFEFQSYCIEALYSIEETEKIQNFLEINRFLAPLLITAYSQIKKFFPDATVLLNFDSEYENNQRLISTILNPLILPLLSGNGRFSHLFISISKRTFSRSRFRAEEKSPHDHAGSWCPARRQHHSTHDPAGALRSRHSGATPCHRCPTTDQAVPKRPRCASRLVETLPAPLRSQTWEEREPRSSRASVEGLVGL